MRFLVDQAVSWQVATAMTSAGHDAIHVREVDMVEAADEEILACAVRDNRVIITQDTDFGTLLAASQAARPSVILLRMRDGHPKAHAAAILGVLDSVKQALEEGAIVVIGDANVRVRKLLWRRETD
jgi:predicted nuclease of predicted toxin-antitoxin system